MPGQCRGIPKEHMGVGVICQGNAENAEECQGNAGEYRGMPGVRMGVGAKCQGMLWNAGEYQGNVWEWVQNARGIQGYAGECQ